MRSSLRRLGREPTVHFMALGVALFLLHGAVRGDEIDAATDRSITVRADTARALDLRGGVEAWVEEEILYREARALGLDRGDPVVRRRLVQRMEFLLEDPAVAVPPSDEELARWVAEHAERYRVPARLRIEQIFFSRDRRGDGAQADAAGALAGLAAGGRTDGLGDAFPLAGPALERTTSQLAASFGADFAEAVTALPEGAAWAGPVRSSYGWHLVRIVARSGERAPSLAEVRSRVQGDYMDSRRLTARRQALEALRRRYDVRIEGGS